MDAFSWQKRLMSFVHAGRGALTLVQTQPNMWIHLAAAIATVSAGVFFGISRLEWALIIIAIGMVCAAEAFNTAIEFLSDEVSVEKRERLGKAKDVAALGVLLAAITSLALGGIVFMPYVARLFVAA